MLVNHPFGLIKSHQGIKRKVSQEPGLAGWRCLAAPSRAAGGTGGGKIVWYQRKLLRTAPNRFSSFFFSFGLVSDLSLPSVCWQTTAGPNPVPRCVSYWVPGVSLPAEAGGRAGEGGREGR